MNTHLLIIDPQQDFTNPKGSLFVPGADKDMERLAVFINRNIKKIDDIHVTLDSHRLIDVAHPIFWINSNGEHPAPFTIISVDDVENGTWTTTNPSWKQRGLDYVKGLADNARYPLCIWPPHCLIAMTNRDGICGHSIDASVSDALLKWQEARFGVVDFCVKGSNIFTEHYSALKADVVDPSDPTTSINTDLLDVLQNADEIVISGEALSHCVRNSILDIIDSFGDDKANKFTLLEDCCSNVPGFESLGDEFLKIGASKGMKIIKSTDYLS
jgi:nicotinamidase-related amidase